MPFLRAGLVFRIAICSLGIGALPTANPSNAAEKLEVGSVAPKLDVEFWIHDGNGQFPKVTSFEKGKVYVVEFWATTCGPCIQSMPHLAQLQKQFADKGLQIVSISSEPLDKVSAFLKNTIRLEDGKETTIEKVTKGYCLATDPDGSSEVDFMLAAKQNTIPSAFIVGKDSRIDWIGHPMEMDAVLESVLNNSWDRAGYIAEKKLIEEIETTIRGFAQRKQFTEAANALDGFIAKVTDKRILFGLYKSKIDMQVYAKADNKAIEKTYEALFQSCAKEPLFVQDAAWTAFEKFSEGEIDSKEIIRMSANAVEKALADVRGGDQANMYDTLARLSFVIDQLDRAIKAQTKAVQLSDGSDQGSFKEFLQELNDAKKSLEK
ncbi:MAG: TlpA disulfide reductase family protein [Pirellula sp.]